MPEPDPSLRALADAPFETQRDALARVVAEDALLAAALDAAEALAAPDWRIVSGAVYAALWNRMDGQPSGYGVKDVDLFCFDADDLSYEAEDFWIRRAEQTFAPVAAAFGVPVELRNQARVHLWYERRFGRAVPPIESVDASLTRFASIAHAVAVHRDAAGAIVVAAPFGLSDLFAMRVRPNRAEPSPETHAEKGARAIARWPGVTVELFEQR